MVLGRGRRWRRRGVGRRVVARVGRGRPRLGEHRKGARKLRLSTSVCIGVAALALAGGCGGGAKTCNDGTVMVTVRFDAATRRADSIDVETVIDGAGDKAVRASK